MKTIKLVVALILFIGLNSCTSDDIEETQESNLIVKKIENLHAPSDVRDYSTGEIISEGITKYFSFSQGTTVAATANWDIAFKGTTIIVNGGVHGSSNAAAAVLVSTFEAVTQAPSDEDFKIDTAIVNAIASGSGNGWYNYNPATHLITPIPGRVIVIKTHDGKYAKMEMLSYYKNQTTTPEDGDDAYLTFNYAYQPNGTKRF